MRFSPAASGRVAIFRVAERVAAETERRVALAPDYICNVVYRALESAGFAVRPYALDDHFEPDPEALRAELARGDVAILLTASLFGSTAMLPLLARQAWRVPILDSRVHVIADLCQDLALIDHLPDGYGDRLTAVLSFNDKSVPGLMGGGILSTRSYPEPHRRAGVADRLRLLREWRTRIAMRDARGRPPDTGWEYSRCRTFPFRIEPVRLTRLQLAAAVVGLKALPALNAARARFVERYSELRRLPHSDSAACLVADHFPGSLPVSRLRLKAGYATPDDPAGSLRPGLRIVISDGRVE